MTIERVEVVQLNNTERFCLEELAARGIALAPATIAKARWPRTRQIAKKAATIDRHIGKLLRLGFVGTVGGTEFYAITLKGRKAAKAMGVQFVTVRSSKPGELLKVLTDEGSTR